MLRPKGLTTNILLGELAHPDGGWSDLWQIMQQSVGWEEWSTPACPQANSKSAAQNPVAEFVPTRCVLLQARRRVLQG